MRLSFLSVAIAIIFVLAIVHAPVEANADPWAEAEAGIIDKLKGKLSGVIKKLCGNPDLLKTACKQLG